MPRSAKKLTSSKTLPQVPPLSLRVVRTQAHFYETKLPRQSEYKGKGLGVYFLLFEVTSGIEALYIPISIATGRKSAGFLYVTEGDGKGATTVALTSEGGREVTTITSGSVVYTRIPAGKTAMFRINGEVIGTKEEVYRILITTVSYKVNPNDFRYKKFYTELSTEKLFFGKKKQ